MLSCWQTGAAVGRVPVACRVCRDSSSEGSSCCRALLCKARTGRDRRHVHITLPGSLVCG
jgi:hypothetical protein